MNFLEQTKSFQKTQARKSRFFAMIMLFSAIGLSLGVLFLSRNINTGVGQQSNSIDSLSNNIQILKDTIIKLEKEIIYLKELEKETDTIRIKDTIINTDIIIKTDTIIKTLIKEIKEKGKNYDLQLSSSNNKFEMAFKLHQGEIFQYNEHKFSLKRRPNGTAEMTDNDESIQHFLPRKGGVYPFESQEKKYELILMDTTPVYLLEIREK